MSEKLTVEYCVEIYKKILSMLSDDEAESFCDDSGCCPQSAAQTAEYLEFALPDDCEGRLVEIIKKARTRVGKYGE